MVGRVGSLAAIVCLFMGCAPADIGEEPSVEMPLPDRDPTYDGGGATTSSSSSGGTTTPKSVTLTVNLTGSGKGTVSSSPAGLTCAVSSCTGSFPAGTAVTLTASPGSGAVFSGFGGACTGTTCAPTLNADATATAQFDTLDGTWTGTYTNTRTAFGCTFNNKGNLSVDLKTTGAAVSTTANITGLELRSTNGCGLVGSTTGAAPASDVTLAQANVTGTWTFNVQIGGTLAFPFKGTLAGKTLSGTWTCSGCTGNFTLTRP